MKYLANLILLKLLAQSYIFNPRSYIDRKGLGFKLHSGVIDFKKYPNDFIVVEDRALCSLLGMNLSFKVDNNRENALVVEKDENCTIDEERIDLSNILSPQQILELDNFNNILNADNLNNSTKEIKRSSLNLFITPELSKTNRTLLHKSIKKVYDNKLISETVIDKTQLSKGTNILIYFKGSNAITKVFNDSKTSKSIVHRWDKDLNSDYVHFTAIKSQLTTSELIDKLCKSSGMLSSRFQYCGNKDKKAITFQRISGWRINDKLIKESLNYTSSIILRDFEPSSSPLKLGDLAGNLFFVKLRIQDSYKNKELELLNNIEAVIQKHGLSSFPNLFGVQRFGYPLPVNPVIGKYLLQNDYRAAFFSLLLSPISEELALDPDFSLELLDSWVGHNTNLTNEAYLSRLEKIYSNYYLVMKERTESLDTNITVSNFTLDRINDICDVLKGPTISDTGKYRWSFKIPRSYSSIQRSLCLELIKQFEISSSCIDKISFSKIFNKLQKSNQQLFVNSYQSLLWNRDAEIRLNSCDLSFDTAARFNDIVLVDKLGHAISSWDVAKQNIILNAKDIKIWSGEKSNLESFDPQKQKQNQSEYYYHIVTQEEDRDKNFPIESVIIPLPGYSAYIPPSMLKQIQADGMETLIKGDQKSEITRVPGAYRHLVSSPLNLKYRSNLIDMYKWNSIEHGEGHFLHYKNFPFSSNVQKAYETNLLDRLLSDLEKSSDYGGLSPDLTEVPYNEMGNKHAESIAEVTNKDNDEKFIQLGFSLCSSTYATTYIDHLISRL